MIFAALAGSTALRAANVKWDDLCNRARTRALTITTLDGVQTAGTCSSQTIHSISLYAGKNLRTLVRDDIVSIRLDNLRRSHCLANIGNVAEMSLIYALYSVGSEYFFLAPVFLVGAPAILAGGPPFCAVFDLVHRWGGSEKITII
jgi:hypothetical protein